MDKKLIVVVEQPFNERNYIRFGLDSFISANLNPEVYDLSPIVQPEYYKLVKTGEEFKSIKVTNFYDYKTLFKTLKNINNEKLFVIALIANKRVLKFFQKENIKYIIEAINTLPNRPLKDNYRFYFFHHCLNVIRRDVRSIRSILSFFQKLFINIFSIFNSFELEPTAMVLGGLGSNTVPSIRKNKKKQIWAHAYDYDLFINTNIQDSINNYEDVVFLDEYFPYHPDIVSNKRPDYEKAERYFPLLDNFFSFIEKIYNSNVIIAAHPRSDYHDKGDIFYGRKIIKGETVELVKNSKFVIAHASTSVNFAVLYKKPVIFITTNYLKNTYNHIEICSSWLGKSPINIDKDFNALDIDKELKIDSDMYKNYTNNFIKRPGSSDEKVWETVASYINNL